MKRKINMGKIHKAKNVKTGKIEYWDEDNCGIFTEADYIKCGARGKEAQYKYFCEHPEEIEDQKLFSKLEKEINYGQKN